MLIIMIIIIIITGISQDLVGDRNHTVNLKGKM